MHTQYKRVHTCTATYITEGLQSHTCLVCASVVVVLVLMLDASVWVVSFDCSYISLSNLPYQSHTHMHTDMHVGTRRPFPFLPSQNITTKLSQPHVFLKPSNCLLANADEATYRRLGQPVSTAQVAEGDDHANWQARNHSWSWFWRSRLISIAHRIYITLWVHFRML